MSSRTRRALLTALYVPGDRPDRFAKAMASGADLVIVDLEDAVAGAHKVEARTAVCDWLAALDVDAPAAVEVRINSGAAALADLEALAAIVAPASAAFTVRVPKVERPDDLTAVTTLLPGVALTALVETAAGVEALPAIVSHPAVAAVNLGEADLASDVGADTATLDYARVRVLYAARAAGLPRPMMSVFASIGDLDGLRVDTERGRRMGFFGRTAIHPTQLEVIRSAFAPSPEDLDWARAVLAAVGVGGVATLENGEMVDPAMIGRAHTLLDLAGETAE